MASAPGRSQISVSSVTKGMTGSTPSTQYQPAAVPAVSSEPDETVQVLGRDSQGFQPGGSDRFAGRLKSAGTTTL